MGPRKRKDGDEPPPIERRKYAFTDEQLRIIGEAAKQSAIAAVMLVLKQEYDKIGLTSAQIKASHDSFARLEPTLRAIEATYSNRRKFWEGLGKLLEEIAKDGAKRVLTFVLWAIPILFLLGLTSAWKLVPLALHIMDIPKP